MTTWAEDMLAGHNEVRASLGLPPLRWSEPLASLASEHCATMCGAGDLFHGSVPEDGGQNVAKGRRNLASNPTASLRLWLADPQHAAWITDPEVELVGAAYAMTPEGDTYVTCNYHRKN